MAKSLSVSIFVKMAVSQMNDGVRNWADLKGARIAGKTSRINFVKVLLKTKLKLLAASDIKSV